MRKKLFLFLMLLPVAMMAQYTIYPIPHSQVAGTGTAGFTETVNLVAGESIDTHTINRAKDVLAASGLTVQTGTAVADGMSNVLLGVNSSGDAADAASAGLNKTAFAQAGKYDRHVVSLTADAAGHAQVIVLGENTDATFCGLASLEQMLDGGTTNLAAVTINDWADLQYRGIIEGYYGVPYTAAVIKDLFRFMARYKMNTFMYGPKTDIYHSTKWADPYPTTLTDEQKKLGMLTQSELADIVNVGHEQKVSFIWAIHPGNAFTNSGNTTVVSQIENKFKMMYQLGVRQFGIFVDDVGVPTDGPTLKLNADRVTEIQNWIDAQWNVEGAAPADTVKPLHFVPQLYAVSWQGEEVRKNFFNALAATPAKVQIYITGWGVWSVPNNSDLDHIKNFLGREPAWWWNYPCNDNDASKLFPADMYANFADETNISNSARVETALTSTKLLISNPMQQGAVSKIALFSIADYAWNNATFDNMKSWEASLPAAVGKDKAEALKTIVPYLRYYDNGSFSSLINSYKSSLNSGRPNSTEILARFGAALEACNSLIEMKTSDDESQRLFYEDAAPWLHKVKLMLESLTTSIRAAGMSDDDKAAKWEQYFPSIASADNISADNADVMIPQLSGGLGSGNSIGSRISEPANQALLPFVSYMMENALGKKFFPAATAAKPELIKSNAATSANVYFLSSSGQAYLTAKEVVLGKDDYVGLSLQKAAKLQTIAVADTLREKVAVLWSGNGKTWFRLDEGTAVPTDYVKYIVLKNEADATYTMKLARATFSINLPLATAIASAEMPEADIYDNHTAGLFIDGDPTTYACIHRNQQSGDIYQLTLKNATMVKDARIYMGTTNGDYPNSATLQASKDGKTWRTFRTTSGATTYTLSDHANVKLNDDVTYCDFTITPMEAKYVRLNVTGPNTSKWLRLYDIVVNPKADREQYFSTATDGNGIALDELTDAKGYTKATTTSGEIVYNFVQMSIATAVTLFMDGNTGAEATVSVTTDGEQWTELGALSGSMQTIDLSAYPAAQAIKISWTGTAPIIYQITETLDESQQLPVTSISSISSDPAGATLRHEDGRLIAEGDVKLVEVYTLEGRRVLRQSVSGGRAVLPQVSQGGQPVIVKLVGSDGRASSYKVR